MKSEQRVETLPAVPENETGYALSQKAADQCRQIVEVTATTIEGKRYVSVEGWQAIAIAHGCVASARDVEAVLDAEHVLVGYRSVGEVRRMDNGLVIATGEGYVGRDETTWFGGTNRWGKVLAKRPDYAIRAMAQTRSISRACRSAFAHVVVIINRDLKTTPAEEMIGLEENEPMPSMMEDARRMSAEQGYKPGDKFRGQHRKVGSPITKDQLLKRQDEQAEAATKWINEQIGALSLITTAAELAEWENHEAVKPRLDALRQGRDRQPGYEHLEDAWKHYEQCTKGLRP